MFKLIVSVLILLLFTSTLQGQYFPKNRDIRIHNKAIDYYNEKEYDKSLKLTEKLIEEIKKSQCEINSVERIFDVYLLSFEADIENGNYTYNELYEKCKTLLKHEIKLKGINHYDVAQRFVYLGNLYLLTENIDTIPDYYRACYNAVRLKPNPSLSRLIPEITKTLFLKYGLCNIESEYIKNVVDSISNQDKSDTVVAFIRSRAGNDSPLTNIFQSAVLIHKKGLDLCFYIDDSISVNIANIYNLLGLKLILLGEFECALDYFIKEQNIYYLTFGEEFSYNFSCCYYIGMLKSQFGEYEKSNEILLDLVDKNVPLQFIDKVNEYYSGLYTHIASNYYALKKYDKSYDYAEKVKEYLEDNKLDNLSFGGFYFLFGCIKWKLSMFQEAVIDFDEAIRLYEEVEGFSKELATTYFNASRECIELENYKHSAAYMKNGISILEQITEIDNKSLAAIKGGLGYIYFNDMQYEQAQSCYDEALELFDSISIKDSVSLATLYSNIGALKHATNDLKSALYYSNLALKIGEPLFENNSELKSQICINTGILNIKLRNFTQAKFYLENAIDVSSDIPTNLYLTYSNLGIVYQELEEFERAKVYYDSALVVLGEPITPLDFKYYLNLMVNIGGFYFLSENYDLAEGYFNECLDLDEQYIKANPESISRAYLGLGSINFFSENNSKAIEYFTKSKILLESKYGTRHSELIPIYYILSLALYVKGEMDKSQESISRCLEVIENTIFQDILYLPPERKEAVIYSLHYFINFYLIFVSTHESGDTKVAYDKYLQFKKLVLNSERFLRSHYSEPQDFYQDTLTYFADSNKIKLTNSGVYFSNFKHSFYNISDSIKAQLSATEACVDYVNFSIPGFDSTYYFAFLLRNDFDVPIVVELFEESEFKSISYKFENEPVSIQMRKMYLPSKHGQELYDLCWSPLESSLDGIKEVYISSSGLLNNISLPILPIGRDSILSDKYKLHYVSSTSDILSKSFKSVKLDSIESCAFFSGIVYDSCSVVEKGAFNVPRFAGNQCNTDLWIFLPEFSKIDSTLDLLKRFFNKTQSFTGVNATKEAFLEMSGNSPDLIHVYTHGFYCEGDNPKQKNKSSALNLLS
jgi:tetratricopeptide (TPR) repeat protein